jgi:hypothetical protein
MCLDYEPYEDPRCVALSQSRNYKACWGLNFPDGCKCGWRSIPGSDHLIYENYEAYVESNGRDGHVLSDITRDKRFKENGYIVRWYDIGLISGKLVIYENGDDVWAEWFTTKSWDSDEVKSRVRLEWDVLKTVREITAVKGKT